MHGDSETIKLVNPIDIFAYYEHARIIPVANVFIHIDNVWDHGQVEDR